MITSDFKNGVYQNKAAKCATSKRAQYSFNLFLVDTLAGIAGAVLLLAPVLVFIYL